MSDVPFVFGGLEPPLSTFENSRVLIWSVPFEKTVSYGRGTKEGPGAIIDASRYMEIYDEEMRRYGRESMGGNLCVEYYPKECEQHQGQYAPAK